ncbi:ABC transporter substrate-binding protein [Cupriavidus agavae]|uniref:Peptide/nickel transport system substrate-binding protein n=1 Tax=Cupriavidus agavae TaxID=1001822 RepID=A0A4Q7RGD5_9BURK|nr:ABC transporter substrate-binding protein [Cupriavidus agavae]RZT30872.1 peptide/nickel transport system substrate-binding protein [Cupriavidus agavae]
MAASGTTDARRRRLLLAAGAALAAPALPLHAHTSSPVPAGGRAVRVIGPWELSALDPLRNGYLFARMQVTETLVGYDAAGLPAPGLAARWQVSPDQLAWRFTLQPGARFHDGSAVQPAHVVAALQRARHAAGMLGVAPIAQIEPTPDGVRIVLTRPFAPLLALLSHSSTQVLAPASFGADGNVRAIIGSGPYRIVDLEPPQRFSIAAHDGWRGPAPAVQRASYLSVGRAEMRALMAEGGQAELAYGLDPGSIARLATSPAVRLHAVTIPRTTALKVNAGHPFLADAAVRRALSQAIDRRGIATAILRDPSLAATQLFPPSLPGWHDDALAPLRFDRDAARAALAQAGWQPGPDGILRRGDARFAITLRTFPDRPELPVIATALQEQFRQVGIAMRVAVGNSGDIPFAHRDGSLDIGLMSRNYGVVPDAFGTMVQDFGGKHGKGGDWGAMGWSDPAVARALAALPATPAGPGARRLRGEIAATLQRDLPLIPVVWYRQTLAASPRLGGVSIDPFERTYRLTDMYWTS